MGQRVDESARFTGNTVIGDQVVHDELAGRIEHMVSAVPELQLGEVERTGLGPVGVSHHGGSCSGPGTLRSIPVCSAVVRDRFSQRRMNEC